MSTVSVELVYRGIFQRTLARNICRGIVFAARKENKVGIAFGRYGDSPERNGIPAKQFAIVADTDEELQASMALYEPTEVDVTIALDDSLCKGVESWAWYGLQPINKLTKKDGTLLITSLLSPEELLKHIHRKEVPYNIALVKGAASFSGLWVFKDDHTDVRVLGALVKVCPQLVSLEAMEKMIREQWKDELKVTSARTSYERVQIRRVEPGEGNPEEPYRFELPKWQEMEEGIIVRGIPQGGGFHGGEGGYQPGRNPYFKKFTTRTMRPVIDFEKCTKCTLCWLQCPDTCFDVTPDGFYDANMEACCGCGVCEAVCPVPDCIVMVNEAAFDSNESQYEMWQRDKEGYRTWVAEKISLAKSERRSHGFQYRGQYEEELAAMRKEA
ncbi:MAG: (4Fe-4S)-binding protein [Nitrospinota bacterium]|nr:MAG: (4Fe-4S)-binding protein [Nitrospinota bacterium]